MQTTTTLYLLGHQVLSDLRDRMADDRGQTSIEWLGIAAVIVAVIAFLVGGPAQSMGGTVRDAFNTLVGDVIG